MVFRALQKRIYFCKKYSFQHSMPKPLKNTNVHQKLTTAEQKNLHAILARQEQRTVLNDFTISYKMQWYQLTKHQPATVQKKDRIIVEERTDGSIHIRLRGKYLNCIPINKRTLTKKQPWILPATAQGVKESAPSKK